MVAMMTFAACEQPQVNNDPPTPTDPAELKITQNYVQVTANGGEYSFDYTIENPDGSTLYAAAQDEWIHDFDLTEDGVVKFTVDTNATGSTRLSKVTLKYGSLRDDIVITQSGEYVEVEIAIDFNFEINGPFVRMHTTPDPVQTRYFAWYYSVKGMETALEQSPGVSIEMYLERLVEVDIKNAIYYGSYAGYSTTEAVEAITLYGPAYQDFELNGDTEYYAYACAVDNYGTIVSDVVYTTFKTGVVEPSANELTIANVNVNTDRVSYDVLTTNMDQYATIVLPAADVENMSDEEFIAFYNEMDTYVSYLNFGPCSKSYILPKEDTDYYIYVFGFEYGMATTEIKRQKIHTLTYDPEARAEFDLTIDKVTHYRIKASLDVSPETSLYYIDVCGADDTAEELQSMVREAAQWYVDNGYYGHIADCLRIVGEKGSKSFDFTGLSPETGYRVYAFGIDEKTGEFNTEVYFSDIITTPAREVSSSYIEIKADKYYDGFDLIELYPEEFSDADGWAVVPLEVEVHGDVVEYYYDIYIGDLTDLSDPNNPTDDEIILDLVQYGKANEPLTMSYCYFYEPLTLIYFSKDSDDNNSVVTRVPLFLYPESCDDATQFPYATKAATAAAKFQRRVFGK